MVSSSVHSAALNMEHPACYRKRDDYQNGGWRQSYAYAFSEISMIASHQAKILAVRRTRIDTRRNALRAHFGQQHGFFLIDSKTKLLSNEFGEKMKQGIFMGYKQTIRSGGKWYGVYWVLDYDGILNVKFYKQIVLRTVKGSEFVVPQLVDKSATNNGQYHIFLCLKTDLLYRNKTSIIERYNLLHHSPSQKQMAKESFPVSPPVPEPEGAPCKKVDVDHSTLLPKEFNDALTCDWV